MNWKSRERKLLWPVLMHCLSWFWSIHSFYLRLFNGVVWNE